MKKILFTAVSALALAAFADGVNSTEFGVLPVPSTAPQTIVSVPWLASGTGTDPVKVADIVLTAGLTSAAPGVEADVLKYYDGSTWYAWTLTEQGGVKSWVADEGVPAEQAIVRGRALLLNRPNEATRQPQFYIMGKPESGTAEVTLGAGYTLVAPTNVSEGSVEANSGTWVGVKLGDQLLIPVYDDVKKVNTYKQLSWKASTDGNGQWRMWNGSTKKWETTGLTIDAGKGAWFVNKDGTTKTVTW